MTQSLSAAVSVPSGTATNLVSITLPTGMWVVVGAINYLGNSNGYRTAQLGTAAASSNMGMVELPAAQSANTRLQITAIASVTAASQTIYLNTQQNSGSAINVNASTTYITAVQIA